MNIGIWNKCIEELQKSEYYPYRIGAVVFKGSRILSAGYNKLRGNGCIHPKYKKIDHSLHAEQAAILDLKHWEKAKGTSILIIRMNQCDSISLSYPCPMCQSLIKHVGIRKVFYTLRNSKIKCIKASELCPSNYESNGEWYGQN